VLDDGTKVVLDYEYEDGNPVYDWAYRVELKQIDADTLVIGSCAGLDACTSYDDLYKNNSSGGGSITCENPVGLTCPEWD
jgi:hypothetical protein